MRRTLLAGFILAGIAVICAVDYATGVEYRVFPLYFLPLSAAAWHFGRRGGLAAAGLCAIVWFASNYYGGLRYSSPSVWPLNFCMQATAFVVVAALIATLRETHAQVTRLSTLDPLTELFNNRAFYAEASRVLAMGRRYRNPVSIAYVDLDGFKAVNDTLGHHAGDDVLRMTGEILRRSIRAADIAARLGGDEFALLLPQTDGAGALAVLERVRASIDDEFEGRSPRVTLSVGIVAFTRAPAGVDELVRRADAAMYTVKTSGKNRIAIETVA